VAAPLVFVRLAVERAAVGQLEVALRPFQRPDRGRLIDREHDRVVGRREVQADDVGGFGDQLGVAREAPGLAPGEVDPLRAQEAPDVLIADVAQRSGEQRCAPADEARGRWLVEQPQNAAIGGLVVGPGLARTRRVGQTRHTLACEPQPPLADHAARTGEFAADRSAPHTGRRQQHHLRPLDQALLRRARTDPALQRAPLVRRQNDRRRVSYRHANP
jgi:hypothetical protein